MKHQKLALGLAVIMLVFAVSRMPLAQAQNDEPSTTAEVCPVEKFEIVHVKFSPDGQYLGALWTEYDSNGFATASSVRVWNVRTGASIATVPDKATEQFAISPDNNYIVNGIYVTDIADEHNFEVRLWDIRSSQKLRTFKSQKFKWDFAALSFSPDGQFIMATFLGAGHSIWNVASGEETYLIDDGYPGFAEFSPNGTVVLTNEEGGDVNLWNWQASKLLYTFNREERSGSGGPYLPATFSPDGKYIVIPQWDGETMFAHARTYQKVHSVDTIGFPWQVSPGEKYLLAGNSAVADGQPEPEKYTVVVWDIEKEVLVQEFPTGSHSIVSFVNNTSILLTKSYEYEAPLVFYVLDVETGRELKQFTVDLIYPNDYAVSPDGQYLALSTYGSIKALWDIETGKPIQLEC